MESGTLLGYCLLQEMNSDEVESLRCVLVAEVTSAKFYQLRSQGKIAESQGILGYIARLEEELGGRLYSD